MSDAYDELGRRILNEVSAVVATIVRDACEHRVNASVGAAYLVAALAVCEHCENGEPTQVIEGCVVHVEGHEFDEPSPADALRALELDRLQARLDEAKWWLRYDWRWHKEIPERLGCTCDSCHRIAALERDIQAVKEGK